MSRILVVEDDPHLASGIVENLRAEGYEVDTVGDGRAALSWLEAAQCSLVVLDVMLPHVDGFTVCRTMRERADNTPVLFLTARGDPQDRIHGLEAGGDDYLAKPFHLQEFLLRVRAIVRRREWYQSASASPAGATLRFGGNEVDFRAFRARSWNGVRPGAHREGGHDPQGAGRAARRDRLARGPAGARLGLRRISFHAHRGQFHPEVAQALRARTQPSRATSSRCGELDTASCRRAKP